MRIIIFALCLALTACASTPRHVVRPADVSFSTHAPADGQMVGRIAVSVENLDWSGAVRAPLELQEKAASKGGNVVVLDTDAVNIIHDALSLSGNKTIWCKVYYSPSH